MLHVDSSISIHTVIVFVGIDIVVCMLKIAAEIMLLARNWN
jgi:hypothetical protein